MDKIVKKGLSVWKIFLKNKLASSIMMLFSGVMMFIAALNGHGNDTKSLPILITTIGSTLTLYATYKIGYLKSDYDKAEEKKLASKILLMQAVETLIYAAVAGLGIFLLANEGFTNIILNLMAGGFTTLNGVLNAIKIYRSRENKDFYWKLMLVLMVFELIIGLYFIIAANSIGINWYIIMGSLTIVAGIIEVISAMTKDGLRCTVDDGKKIMHILKDRDNSKYDDIEK